MVRLQGTRAARQASPGSPQSPFAALPPAQLILMVQALTSALEIATAERDAAIERAITAEHRTELAEQLLMMQMNAKEPSPRDSPRHSPRMALPLPVHSVGAPLLPPALGSTVLESAEASVPLASISAQLLPHLPSSIQSISDAESSAPSVTRSRTWAERDAQLREQAVSVSPAGGAMPCAPAASQTEPNATAKVVSDSTVKVDMPAADQASTAQVNTAAQASAAQASTAQVHQADKASVAQAPPVSITFTREPVDQSFLSDSDRQLLTSQSTCLDYVSVIRVLGCKDIDPTGRSWFQRTVYTPEVAAARTAVGPLTNSMLATSINAQVFTIGDRLREATQTLAAAEVPSVGWNIYRPFLASAWRTLLQQGADWNVILQCLQAFFSTAYERIHGFILTALRDTALLRHPLKHADTLLFKLDTSFDIGYEYASGAVSARWNAYTCRASTVDLLSLVEGLLDAYLHKHRSRLQRQDIWANEDHRRTFYTKFKECLLNDVDDPDRGAQLHSDFTKEWYRLCSREDRKLKGIDVQAFDILEIVSEHLIPLEAAYYFDIKIYGDADAVAAADPYRRPAGHGARARRDAERAASADQRQQQYNLLHGPPPPPPRP